MRTIVSKAGIGIFGVALMLAVGDGEAATPPSTTASGSGINVWQQCSTCDTQTESSSFSAGGPYHGLSNADGGGNGFEFLASSVLLTGTAYLPQLKVLAKTFVPDNPPTPSLYTQAAANAAALQLYTYTGTAGSSYTITFSVDGNMDGDNAGVTAGLLIYTSDYDPFAEGGGGPNTFIAGETMAVGNVGQFNQTRFVTFDVTPGESFYVRAYMSATALYPALSGGTPSTADVSNTFNASFTAGDPLLLVAELTEVSSVPEPSQSALLAFGLLAIAGMKIWRRVGVY